MPTFLTFHSIFAFCTKTFSLTHSLRYLYCQFSSFYVCIQFFSSCFLLFISCTLLQTFTDKKKEQNSTQFFPSLLFYSLLFINKYIYSDWLRIIHLAHCFYIWWFRKKKYETFLLCVYNIYLFSQNVNKPKIDFFVNRENNKGTLLQGKE
jgi:hypothetical protein